MAVKSSKVYRFFLSLCIRQHNFDVIFKEAVYDRTMQTSMDGSMMKFDNTLYK